MCRRFISGSVYMIFYHPKWNLISVKMADMKSIFTMSFKPTCALNATSNRSNLILFPSGKLCWHENFMPVWNLIWIKMTDMKSILFWVHFASIHVNTSKELTEHGREIFNQNDISYRFEFISPLMWTYSEILISCLGYQLNNNKSMVTWETKWNHTSLKFQTSKKTSSVHMKFLFGCISKWLYILMDMFKHFISGNVYLIFYQPKWNLISVKMTDMKSIPALSLNAHAH